jgi:crotonobetainyl-CoA:carnitine CoA-transferase CaiB-like acyl-CoA transferase
VRFASFVARGRHREEVLARLSARCAERTTAAWLETLQGVVPVAPVRSLEQALDPEELKGREMLAEYEHPTFGTVRSVGLPLHLGDFTPEYHAGPALGADTGAVLEGLGYDAAQVAALRAAGAFGGTARAGEPAGGD